MNKNTHTSILSILTAEIWS